MLHAPDLSKDKEVVKALCNCIHFYKKDRPLFYLLGDFNLPSINWENLCTKNGCANVFLEFCISECLEQVVHEHTTMNNSIIDLLLCDELSSRRLTAVQVLPPLASTCDHCMIEFQISVNKASNSPTISTPHFCYEKGDYDSINLKLSRINWLEVFCTFNNDIQQVYDFFLETIHGLMTEHIPTKVYKPVIKFPKELKRLEKQKRSLYRQYKNDKSLKQKYKKLTKKYDKKIREWFEYKESKVLESKKDAHFYNYINKKLKSHPSIPQLKRDEGETYYRLRRKG